VDAHEGAAAVHVVQERVALVVCGESLVVAVRKNDGLEAFQGLSGEDRRIVRRLGRQTFLGAKLFERRHAVGDVVVDKALAAGDVVARVDQDIHGQRLQPCRFRALRTP
jgi:hypothetical protein